MSPVLEVDDLLKKAFSRHQSGELIEAELLYREVLRIDVNNINALYLLGAAAVVTGRASEGLPLLERAARFAGERGGNSSQYSVIYNNLGNALSILGRGKDAISSYRKSLEMSPGDAEVLANLGGELLAAGDLVGAIESYAAAVKHTSRADWHYHLGKAYAAQNSIDAAEASYRAALKADAVYIPALYDLGLLLLKHHDLPAEAIVLFERLRAADPAHVEVHRAMGNVFRRIHRYDRAIACYRRYVACLPDSPTAHLHLGTTLSEAGYNNEAVPYLERAAVLNATNGAVAHVEIGNAFLRAKDYPKAATHFLQANRLQPLITRKAATAKARFSVIFVIAPGVANTPFDYLVGRGDYDSHFLWMVAGGSYDPESLRASADLVMNLISDADQGQFVLPLAIDVIDRIGKPVVNHPRQIALTDRVLISQASASVVGCRVPNVRRFAGAALLAKELPAEAGIFRVPFLARIAGRHGGEDFEKIDSDEQLKAFVGRHPAADYYLMDYVDYQSADGFFRKYRCFWVGDSLLPYHLAIGGHWKVHHFSTDMGDHAWMKQEEEAFLAHPEAAFGPRQMEALRGVAKATGLDFVGLDCGLDRDNNVVLFEANAAMLVHDNNIAFPYKTPYVRKIKQAFDAMLARKAQSTGNRP